MKYAALYPTRFLGLYSQRAKENKLAVYLLFSLFLVAKTWSKHCSPEFMHLSLGKAFKKLIPKEQKASVKAHFQVFSESPLALSIPTIWKAQNAVELPSESVLLPCALHSLIEVWKSRWINLQSSYLKSVFIVTSSSTTTTINTARVILGSID